MRDQISYRSSIRNRTYHSFMLAHPSFAIWIDYEDGHV